MDPNSNMTMLVYREAAAIGAGWRASIALSNLTEQQLREFRIRTRQLYYQSQNWGTLLDLNRWFITEELPFGVITPPQIQTQQDANRHKDGLLRLHQYGIFTLASGPPSFKMELVNMVSQGVGTQWVRQREWLQFLMPLNHERLPNLATIIPNFIDGLKRLNTVDLQVQFYYNPDRAVGIFRNESEYWPDAWWDTESRDILFPYHQRTRMPEPNNVNNGGLVWEEYDSMGPSSLGDIDTAAGSGPAIPASLRADPIRFIIALRRYPVNAVDATRQELLSIIEQELLHAGLRPIFPVIPLPQPSLPQQTNRLNHFMR